MGAPRKVDALVIQPKPVCLHYPQILRPFNTIEAKEVTLSRDDRMRSPLQGCNKDPKRGDQNDLSIRRTTTIAGECRPPNLQTEPNKHPA